MKRLFQNKYRVDTIRLKKWDYRSNAPYFIAICTHNRKHYFGDIDDEEMILSDIGNLAFQFWQKIQQHFPFIELGAFVVMPNHIHGIVFINHVNGRFVARNESNNVRSNNTVDDYKTKFDNDTETNSPKGIIDSNNKGFVACNESTTNERMAEISPKVGSLSTVMRSYKSHVSKTARKIDPDFGWQSRFWEHIIKDGISYNRIENYIQDNPTRWQEDMFSNPK